MGVGQVADMDIVAHPGTVGRVVVAAEDVDMRQPAEHGLAGPLDQMCRHRRDLATAPAGIGPGNVEIAQHDMRQRCRPGCVGQRPFGHPLATGIGIGRIRRHILRQPFGPGLAIDGGGGGKDEGGDAGGLAGLQQGEAVGGVVAVVVERPLHRFRHYDGTCEVQHRAAIVLSQQIAHQVAVADIARDERRARGHQRASAG